jgi:hypothetical protein
MTGMGDNRALGGGPDIGATEVKITSIASSGLSTRQVPIVLISSFLTRLDEKPVYFGAIVLSDWIGSTTRDEEAAGGVRNHPDRMDMSLLPGDQQSVSTNPAINQQVRLRDSYRLRW